MTISIVAKKLGMKPGMRALVAGAPPGYLKLLAPLPEVLVVSDVMNSTHQFVQLFASHSSEIKKSAPRLMKHAAAGALVWIGYSKKTSGVASDLSREAVCEAMSGTGWRAVAIVAIDEVWSALRFRPAIRLSSADHTNENP
jgi:hypothetical protein